ncbi:MAG: transcriptional regulator, partial [Candidatus Omnitrophica bacterium]|nr:transcriptional regulator [Candidatus Omnitrophota bacterium]
MNNMCNNKIIKTISISLSALLLWQSVVWANPELAKGFNLQSQTLFTGLRKDDGFFAACAGYLTRHLTELESDPYYCHSSRFLPTVEKLIIDLENNKDLPLEYQEHLPNIMPGSDASAEVIINAGAFKIRYYNPRVANDDPGTGFRVCEDKPIGSGRYVRRQILIQKALPAGKAAQIGKNARAVESTLTFQSGDRDKATVTVHKEESPQIGKRAHLEKIIKSQGSLKAQAKDSKGQIHEFDLKHQGVFDVTNLKMLIDHAGSIDHGHKDILLAMLSLLEKSPPELYAYDTLIEDLFGFASPENNMIALHDSLTTGPESVIAHFHEIGEYLLKRHLLRGQGLKLKLENDAIIVTIDGKRIGQPVKLTREDATRQVKKDPENPHYLLRALQREIFGEVDKGLTDLIKHDTGEVDTAPPLKLSSKSLTGQATRDDNAGAEEKTDGQILRSLREQLGLYQREFGETLATALNWPRPTIRPETISTWERGIRPVPSEVIEKTRELVDMARVVENTDGQILKSLRKQLGLSQEEFGKTLATILDRPRPFSGGTISTWEKGIYSVPSEVIEKTRELVDMARA